MLVIFKSFTKELFLKKLQGNFLLSITHELKTPLTAIKLYMETFLKRNIETDQMRLIADNSLQETKRLQDLVEKLLLSAQLEGHKYTLEKQSINLSELVNEVIDNFNKTRPNHQKIEANIQDQVIISGDPNALEMILNNLLSNGIKYGGEYSLLKVDLKQINKVTYLSISDEGDGISEEDKKLLFNKFYRIGDENTRKTKGTGLGLFIVKNLVNLHGGKISVANNHPKGTIFKIKLQLDAQ
jgi:signal transduction histidine kinase